MKCNVCGSENLEGSAYCEDCGTKLSAAPAAPMATPAPIPAPIAAPVAAPIPAMPVPEPAPAVPAMPTIPAPVAAPQQGSQCAACGAVNTPGAAFCDDCGASLTAAAPSVEMPAAAAAPIAAPAAPSQPAAPIEENRPRLLLPDNTAFIIDKEEIELGRNSPADNIFPEVDLTSHDPESYVSRRHGHLTNRGNGFLYEDVGYSNGSYLNGNRLQANVQVELHNGDSLRLGRTEMTFRC